MITIDRTGSLTLALLVVALVFGPCLVASVEVSSTAHHECNALTDAQTHLSKPPAALSGLVGIPVAAMRLVVPHDAVNRPPCQTTGFAATAAPDTLAARSPPGPR